MALLGLGLLAIGSIGVFFGRMIQSSISRQRELLADASAVQFTRDTDGLVGALKKIGGAAPRSYLQHTQGRRSESHLLLGGDSPIPFVRRALSHAPAARGADPQARAQWDGEFPRWAFRTSPRE